jgi:uncharacterized protein YyaL (SSP411 family)
VLLRLKEDYDGAEPSASSVAVHNLLTLAHLTGDEQARARVEQTLGRYGRKAGRAARVIPMMLAALSAWHAGASQIVVVGDVDDRRPLAAAVARHFLPFAIHVPLSPATQSSLAVTLPFVAAMRMLDGKVTAYVCRNFSCRAPVTSPEMLEAELHAS